MNNMAHIIKIRIPGLKEPSDRLLYPAVPSSVLGAINVFCGPNNSGKSYFLEAIAALLGNNQASKNYQGFEIVLNNDIKNVRYYLPGPYWNSKEGMGVISGKYKNIDPNKPSDFRNFSLQFFSEVLNRKPFGSAKDIPRDDLLALLDQITEDEFIVKECDSNHEVVALLEKYLKAKLLYRKAKAHIELVLANPTGLVVPFFEWSDGQKAVLYFLLCLKYWKPDVLLVDELENHLHPIYMSEILDLIKSSVPQTFVATHHPHIIFSEYVDQAFYIETITGNNVPRVIDEKYIKVQQQAAPKRRITTLSNDFDKLTATYKLFTVQDRQLLKQATQIEHEADFALYREIIEMFFQDVIEAKNKTLPDRQTSRIISSIESITRKKEITILDFGSGLGRVVKEFSKSNKITTQKKISWYCWEPFDEYRTKLRQIISGCPFECVVLEKLENVQRNSCDVVIVANVVHEINPHEFAELLVNVKGCLANDGIMIMAEIHPLLHAEKYSVPYPEYLLKDFLIKMGFSCSSQTFSVKDSQAYCITASSSFRPLPQLAEVISAIEEIWNSIKRHSLSSYASKRGVTNSADYRTVLMDMNTITSVEAWETGLWGTSS